MTENSNDDFTDDGPRPSYSGSFSHQPAAGGRRRRWLRLALIWGIWTFVGLVFTLQSYFTSYRSEQPMSIIDSAYLQFTWSYLWALATPLVLWAASRIPIERSNWLRGAFLHVPVSLGLSIVVTAIGHVFVWLYWGRTLGRPFSFERMTRFVVLNFSEGIGIYMLIALSSYAFSYYRRYRESQMRTFQLEAQLSQAQLQALKMQLHPHFLFNTLHSISALLNKDPESARKMITRLGDFLRLTLENSGSQEVTLEQEMTFLRCYLEIERVRFQDRLVTRVDVPEQTLDARVPNLILQPIVENAIRHGIAPRSTPGLIEIEAERRNSTLRIRVRDNGPGLPNHRTSENMFKKGLGLANTEKRLEQLYGADHLFDLSDHPEGGLVVTLEIPFHKDGSASTSEVV
jgi:sensor histidine kinase YesM